MTKIKLEYLNELSGGDVDFISSMIKTYLEETGREIKLLEESFDKKDRGRISFWAHKIKASFYLMGLEQLSKAATELELKSKNYDIALDSLRKDIDYIVEKAEISFQHARRLVKDL
jgi:HPt (histidine-containing phosphotransfer) domain-containing protein